MQNGLYSAVFGTQMGQGAGVVFLKDGVARGGDSLMSYRGNYRVTGDALVGELLVAKHANDPATSVFGRDLVNIKMTGKVTGDRIDITGTAVEVPGAQFRAQLKRLSD